MKKESTKRSIVKSLSWRFLATLTTAILVFLFTGNFVLALSIGSVEAIAKMVIYYFHERTWNNLSWGLN